MSFLKVFYHPLFRKTSFYARNQTKFFGESSRFTRRHPICKEKLWFHQISAAQYCTTGSYASTRTGNFQDMMKLRRSQARSTVLIELASKDDVPYVVSLVKDIGKVNTILSYIGEHKEVFLLTEYVQEESAKKFLQRCQLKSIVDTFPFSSRLVLFERKKKRKSQLVDVSGLEEIVPKPVSYEIKHASPSDMMTNLYESEKVSEVGARLRFLFSCLIEDALYGMFPDCAAIPFGSSVNSFGKDGCDLDVMLRLCPEKTNSKAEFLFQTKTCVGDTRVLQQRSITGIYEVIRLFFPGITYVQRILQARIPILKFKHKILSLDCDVSVNNMSAIYMSELLYFLGELDSRVRPLVFTIKKWAKLTNITCESPGSWITNFSLTLLVIFFLQTRPVPILPPLLKAVSLHECHDYAVYNAIQYLENTEKWKSMASLNKETLETLLVEFFHFLISFDFQKEGVSLLTGEAMQIIQGQPLWIQYPMDELMNVSKNVSNHEFQQLCEISRCTLESMSRHRTNVFPDFETLFGAVTIKSQPGRIDINALYDNTDVPKQKKNVRVIR